MLPCRLYTPPAQACDARTHARTHTAPSRAAPLKTLTSLKLTQLDPSPPAASEVKAPKAASSSSANGLLPPPAVAFPPPNPPCTLPGAGSPISNAPRRPERSLPAPGLGPEVGGPPGGGGGGCEGRAGGAAVGGIGPASASEKAKSSKSCAWGLGGGCGGALCGTAAGVLLTTSFGSCPCTRVRLGAMQLKRERG